MSTDNLSYSWKRSSMPSIVTMAGTPGRRDEAAFHAAAFALVDLDGGLAEQTGGLAPLPHNLCQNRKGDLLRRGGADVEAGGGGGRLGPVSPRAHLRPA